MRHSLLQTEILAYLAEHSARTVTDIAKNTNHFRSSVSRALKLLKSKGMVENTQGWKVTSRGLQEVLSVFRPANDIDWRWGDCTMGFECLCGDEIVLSNAESLSECECGRIYRFTSAIEVKG